MRSRLAIPILSTLMALGLIITMAACAKRTPPAGPPAATDTAGSPILGGAPTTEPPVASPTGGGATTSPPAPLPTPHSTLSSRAAFVWTGLDFTGAYRYNSAGGTINVINTGTGKYTVKFAGLGVTGGVAHAQAYGNTSNYCTVDGWGTGGGTVSVNISCFDQDGQYANTTFVASYARGSQSNVRFSYLWADQAGTTSAYHPDSGYRYDSVSSAGITSKKLSLGKYEVYLPAAGPELTDPYSFQVTAYSNRYQCKLDSFTVATRKAVVACRTSGGGPADTQFTLSFASEGSILGRTGPRFGEGSSSSDGVQNPSSGHYIVRIPQLAGARGHVAVLATGSAGTYCHVQQWEDAGPDMDAYLVCFNPGGGAASSQFLVAATW